MSFLKAEWRKLGMANYEVDSSLLKKYLPAGTELDTWNGINYVSLVGFMFKNTKVLGIKIPFHINFEEVNLRFYVRYKDQQEWKRGVVFIKEIVPKHAITFVANQLYHEHYVTRKMKHEWRNTDDAQLVKYQWLLNRNWQSFEIKAAKEITPIITGSEAEFITEHYWGYTRVDNRRTIEYEVTHPTWDQYEVKDYQIKVDFAANYGEEFKFLNQTKPKSIMLAEGSLITVENKRNIRIS